jgi:hypothetical protein
MSNGQARRKPSRASDAAAVGTSVNLQPHPKLTLEPIVDREAYIRALMLVIQEGERLLQQDLIKENGAPRRSRPSSGGGPWRTERCARRPWLT